MWNFYLQSLLQIYLIHYYNNGPGYEAKVVTMTTVQFDRSQATSELA